MSTWTPDELQAIAAASELRIASRRPDGTLSRPVVIWVVRLGDDLFVRSVRGGSGAWFRGADRRREGRIQAGGVAKDVGFEDADHALDDAIDAAYKEKYGYPSDPVDHITSEAARETTIQLVSR